MTTTIDSSPKSPANSDFDVANSAENSSIQPELDATNLESLWAELGLPPSEIAKQQNKLARLISGVRYNAKKEATAEKIKYVDEIQRIKDRHISLMKAIGESDEECQIVEDSGFEGTLRERLQEVQENLKNFEPKCIEILSEFNELKQKTDVLFEKLGVCEEERGEFAEVGEKDLSQERKKRFIEKEKQLKEEIEERKNVFRDLKENIYQAANKIGTQVSDRINEIFTSEDLTPKSLDIAREYLDDLNMIYKSRVSQISELAIEITREWDLLGVSESQRKEFINAHSQLTEKCIQELSDERLRLRNLKTEKLPELIEHVKSEIISTCETLHLSKNEIEELLDNVPTVPEDNLTTFKAFENLSLEMKRVLLLSQPILDLINQKDEIIKEYNELLKDEQDLNKPKNPKTDKIKRRYKFILPRVEKKLLLAALEFKQINGTDFIWEGQKIVDIYSNIKLSKTELAQVRSDSRKRNLEPKTIKHGHTTNFHFD